MQKLPHWVLTNPFPSMYDLESATAIEMVAKLYGAMNTMIDEFNSFVDGVNKEIDSFTSETRIEVDAFEKTITELTQNYLKCMDTKMEMQDLKIDNAIKYMKDNIVATATELLNQAIAENEITVTVAYNETTEEINIVGGV